MSLHISSRLAMYALIELARDPERQVSVAEIASKYNISTHHLAKVMHTLGRAGLVRSIRGVGGGYVFTGNAKRTTLLDIINLFEGAFGNDGETGDSNATEWALEQVLFEIDDIARATFGAITLATMIRQTRRRELSLMKSAE